MWSYNDNELYHHGVKGMKWGKRKKQSFATDMSNRPHRGLLTDGPMNRDEHRRSMEQKDKQVRDGIKKVIQKKSDKAEQKEFKQDVKETRKLWKATAKIQDEFGNILEGKYQTRDILYLNNAAKKGQDYANRVLKTAKMQRTVSAITKGVAGAAAIAAGIALCKKYNVQIG